MVENADLCTELMSRDAELNLLQDVQLHSLEGQVRVRELEAEIRALRDKIAAEGKLKEQLDHAKLELEQAQRSGQSRPCGQQNALAAARHCVQGLDPGLRQLRCEHEVAA